MVAAIIAVGLAHLPDTAWAKKKKPKAETEQSEDFGDAAVGRRYHQQILQYYGIYDDKALSDYVRNLGLELVEHAEGDKYDWHFTVLDSPTVNAFATPGGFVYITRGLLAYLNTEAQLAAVLGHEIGHITHRHAARQHTAVEAIASVSDKMAAKFDDPNQFNLGDLFGAGLVSGYGREMELEADEIGASLTSAIGHDPRAMLQVIEMFKALEEYALAGEEAEQVNRYHTMLSSHPDQERRRRELLEAASGDLHTVRDPGRDILLQHIDGLAWSGSTSQGVIRGNRFLHQELGISVTFPEGWEIGNLPDKLIAMAPRESAMMQVFAKLRTLRRHKKMPVDKYPVKMLGMNRWQSAKVLEINGMDAFIATVHGVRGLHGTRAGRVGIVYLDDWVFEFFGTAKDADRQRRYDRQFDTIIKSFKRLDETDRHLAEPAAIRIVKLEPGASLGDFPPIEGVEDTEALLLMINGLYPDGEPQPGDQIKTIQ